ncbi:MAG: glycoside hydrolase family 19 protein [Methylobacteriaceae bacterium]|nr:glycoside hydrolase family 19 protein [Methylobacteriaceae bacterium]
MSLITADQLHRISPVARSDIVAAIIDKADEMFPAYGLATLLRVRHFLAQVAEETGGLRVLEEDLDYSAMRLMQVWPARFPTLATAEPYAHNPRRLADRVYGGRMGNTGPDDGWKYRGRGLLQTTGKATFALLQHDTGLPLVDQPELASAPEHMLQCAVVSFVRIHGVLAACDRNDVVGVTRLVNGGLTNLAARRLYLAHCDHAIAELGAIGAVLA